MVDVLSSKARAWEKERGVSFSYDGVHLLTMIEQYSTLKQEKELERQRQRDQKKLHGQLIAEQEVLFGSKPSPKSGKKVPKSSTSVASNRRQSLAPAMLQNVNPEKTYSLLSSSLKKGSSLRQHKSRNQPQTDSLWSTIAGERNLNSSGNARQHSAKESHTQGIESTPARNPLSPVFSAFSSKANANTKDPERAQSEDIQKTIPSDKTPSATPVRNVAAHDENKTPKTMPIPMPATPPTISVPMKIAMTPSYPATECRGPDGVEYSFEERRAGFVLPKA